MFMCLHKTLNKISMYCFSMSSHTSTLWSSKIPNPCVSIVSSIGYNCAATYPVTFLTVEWWNVCIVVWTQMFLISCGTMGDLVFLDQMLFADWRLLKMASVKMFLLRDYLSIDFGKLVFFSFCLQCLVHSGKV